MGPRWGVLESYGTRTGGSPRILGQPKSLVQAKEARASRGTRVTALLRRNPPYLGVSLLARVEVAAEVLGVDRHERFEMPVFGGSRYERSNVEFFEGADGTPRQVLSLPFPDPVSFAATQHVVSEGERMESIAALYYRDPTAWWVIAQANPEQFFPEKLSPGVVLRIPRDRFVG